MVVVIIISHRYKINPDSKKLYSFIIYFLIEKKTYFFSDVATPIAASLGDLTTLGLLAAISTWLFNAISNFSVNRVNGVTE